MPLHGFAFEAVPEAPHLADLPLLDALHRALPEQAIAEVVAATGVQEQRRRLLPARLVVALVVALGLWAGWHLPAKSALTQARQRLGPRPLRVLFHRLAGPVAAPTTPGAFLFGLRLM